MSDSPIHELAVALSAHTEELCRRFLSNGKRVGNNWVCAGIRNPPDPDGDSCSVCLEGPKAGLWCDLGNCAEGEEGGDIFDAVRIWSGCPDNIKTADWAREFLQLPAFHKNGHATPKAFNPLKYPWKRSRDAIEEFFGDFAWTWHDPAGSVIGYTVRFNKPGGKKDVKPLTNQNGHWIWKAWPDKFHPIYNAHLIVSRPNDPILIVEGEKSADAAAKLFRSHVCVSWYRGAGAVAEPDWSVLIDRDVTLWPDADGEGAKAMNYLKSLHPHCKVVDVSALPEGWDLADKPPEGVSIQGLFDGASAKSAIQPVSADDPEWLSLLSDKGKTELANSVRFEKDYGTDARFCHPWGKWIAWTGTHWTQDADGVVRKMAKKIPAKMWADIGKSETLMNQGTVQFAKNSSKSAGISAMLSLAQSALPVSVSEMDANDWLLNCPNGTVDLRTGELINHRREDFLTKICPTPFLKNSQCPWWETFMLSIFAGDMETITFMERLLGYALTGDVSEQIMPVFHGSGSNGKSTLLDVIQDVLGHDYTSAAPPNLLMEKKTDSHPTELAGLFGRRLVVAQETNQGARLAEGIVKQLTGGDKLQVRRMREDFWEFDPTHKLILCTNHKPRVRGNDHAIWRRLLLVPFSVTFWNPENGETGEPKFRRDNTLRDKLLAEAPGILARLVQACLDWQRDGLNVPDSVRAATTGYKSDSDVIGRFIAECCVTLDSLSISFANFFNAFEKWCSETGENPPSKRSVGLWFQQSNFEAGFDHGRIYKGLALKAE